MIDQQDDDLLDSRWSHSIDKSTRSVNIDVWSIFQSDRERRMTKRKTRLILFPFSPLFFYLGYFLFSLSLSLSLVCLWLSHLYPSVIDSSFSSCRSSLNIFSSITYSFLDIGGDIVSFDTGFPSSPRNCRRTTIDQCSHPQAKEFQIRFAPPMTNLRLRLISSCHWQQNEKKTNENSYGLSLAREKIDRDRQNDDDTRERNIRCVSEYP